MKSVRELLNEAGFDWATGRILYQRTKWRLPGQASKEYVSDTIEISKGHPVLDWKPTRSGGFRIPRIVAFDSAKIYFPVAYECADSIECIFLTPDEYLSKQNQLTPYLRR